MREDCLSISEYSDIVNLVGWVDGCVKFLLKNTEQEALEDIELVCHVGRHIALVYDAL